MKGPLLELCQVCKDFDQKTMLFQNVNLKIYPGKTYAIEGVSGVGKSTLLQCMAGHDTPSAGTIFFEGARLTDRLGQKLRQNTFGYIFQSYHLLEDLTAEENIWLAMEISGQAIDKKRAAYLLETLGMSAQAKKNARYLSGGEKQRISIARALANHPKIIFADEPTASLDRHTSQAIEAMLFQLVNQENITLVLATHDKSLSEQCDYSYRLTSHGLLQSSEPK